MIMGLYDYSPTQPMYNPLGGGSSGQADTRHYGGPPGHAQTDPPKVTLFMGGERVYPEREVVEREREAFRAGLRALYAEPSVPAHAATAKNRLIDHAVTRYPLPKVKVTQMRVARGVTPQTNHLSYRYNPDTKVIEVSQGAALRWESSAQATRAAHLLPPEFLRMIADLKANPTEEVEVDA